LVIQVTFIERLVATSELWETASNRPFTTVQFAPDRTVHVEFHFRVL
jgi:hypothetical protein